MKRLILLSVSLVLFAVQGWSAPVDFSKAQSIALNFSNSNGRFNTPSGRTSLKLAHAEQSGNMKNQPVFYVFNTADGYIIVSGDDRADAILGYGDGKFDINDIPDGMRDLLMVYKEDIEFLQAHPKLKVEKISQVTLSLTASSGSYVPGTELLNTRWNQSGPYWNQCIFKYGSGRKKGLSEQCLTGCGATAMAQIMYYWKYPNTAPSMVGYDLSSRLRIPSLPTTSFQWSYMRPAYNLENDKSASANAVATLMRYAGQSIKAEYGTGSTSGGTVYEARSAFVNKFSYSTNAKAISKSSYTNSQWNTMLITEIKAKRPVYYVATGTGCHAFVIHGYKNTGVYRINWGWGGHYDGWFALNAFNPGSSKYNDKQMMIIGLQPKSGITTTSPSPSSIAVNSLLDNLNELSKITKIYAEGQNIIVESPKEQKAIISDITGHTWTVNLQTGRNEIPINASGIFIVRIREKSTKLMLR